METRELKQIYRDMAYTLNALQNCIKSNNQYWVKEHKERILSLIDELPHGSGIDGKWEFDYDVNAEKMLRLYCSYHVMDDYGVYNGWIDFIVCVYPHMFFGIELKITGNFGKHQDIKEYLYELLQ